MVKNTIIACLCGFLICSCASNPRIDNLSIEQREKLSTLVVITGKPQKQYDVIGTVDGLSCHRNKHQVKDISEDEALQGIKIKAALIDADAVINVYCQKNSDIDWVNNCWASIKCIGDAVKYK